ncbi:MAG: class I SAM-dependent methyltransferase [Terracidiphilus sp.]
MQLIVKEFAKLGLNAAQTCGVALGRATGLIDFPVPPNSSMRKTGAKTVRNYYISGVSCYLPIATMALQSGVRLREKISVLDFGCGVGRQLLHFTRNFPVPAYSACDVDHSAVGFIARNYPSVTARTNKFDPPLPFESGSMDMVYSVSTFSHINPEHQGDWLREMHRVTRPGGYCFLTTEGWTAFKKLRKMFPSEAAERELREKGILYKEYEFYAEAKSHKSLSPVVDTMVGIDKSYGSTAMTPEYIFDKWNSVGFKVISIVEGIIDNRQDLIVLHKAS